MFELFNRKKQLNPIKIWLDNIEQLEESCLEQAINLANLPFIYKWVAIMPDAHSGFGMPIGGVMACKDVIVPNGVGVDIGCGVAFVSTDLPVQILKENNLLQAIIKKILQEIPAGFSHHKEKKESKVLEAFKVSKMDLNKYHHLVKEIERGYYQIGTLGGGNHFIELQEDEQGLLCIMIHSGSRNFGKQICDYFNFLAKDVNTSKNWNIPKSYDLAYLHTDREEGKQYIRWMNLALDFARENRQKMLEKVKNIISSFSNIKCHQEINCHHNYAALETHYQKEVWVHRKGAIKVEKDELGIIPGAMGSYSFIVKGLGNPESFCSCSHGAGRVMSRKKAKKKYSVTDVLKDLEVNGVIIGKEKMKDIAEEARFVYKDIEMVINQELDLIQPLKKMKTIGVVKG